ncbi:MAG: endonuclease VIII [Myxococcota bacterium]
MPEGPEIRRAADRVGQAIAGRPATQVFFAFEHLKRWEPVLSGRRVEAVDAWGKAMLTRFEGGLVVYSHNQLYGRWYVRKAGSLPDTKRQLRFAVHNADASALLYSASEIDVLDAAHLDAHPFLAKLGPDLLDAALGEKDLRARLRMDAYRRRQLAAVYLDQGFLAGLGNYLRAEILFLAGAHPKARVADLDAAGVRKLAKATLEVGQRAYATGGRTLDARTHARMKKRGGSRRELRFFVYGRAGRPCHRCGERVKRIDAGGRHIYFCPGCQPA